MKTTSKARSMPIRIVALGGLLALAGCFPPTLDVSGTYVEPSSSISIVVETEFPDTACTATFFGLEAMDCNLYSSLGFTFLELVLDNGPGEEPSTARFLAPPAGNQTPVGLGLISLDGEPPPPAPGGPWLFFWRVESTGTGEADP